MLPEQAADPAVQRGPLERQLRGGYSVDPVACVREAWALFCKAPGRYVGYTMLIMAILFPLELPSQIVALADPGTYPDQVVLLSRFLSTISAAVSGPLYAGFYVVSEHQFSGRPVAFRDFFGGFRHWKPLVLFAVASGLFFSMLSVVYAVFGLFFGFRSMPSLLAFLVLVVPAVIYAVSYGFTQFLIIDRRMSFWKAMQTSRKVVGRHWFRLFMLFGILLLINIVGLLAALVGSFVAVPVSYVALTVAYRQVFGVIRDDW